MTLNDLLERLENLEPNITIYLCKYIYDTEIIVGEDVFTPSTQNNEFQQIKEIVTSNKSIKDKIYKADTFLSNYDFILIKSSSKTSENLIEHYLVTDSSTQTVCELLVYISKTAVMKQLSRFSDVKNLLLDSGSAKNQNWVKIGDL